MYGKKMYAQPPLTGVPNQAWRGEELAPWSLLLSHTEKSSEGYGKGPDFLSSGVFLTIMSSLTAPSLGLWCWSPACCSSLRLRPVGRTAEESLGCTLPALYIAALQRGRSSSLLSQLLLTTTSCLAAAVTDPQSEMGFGLVPRGGS